MCLLVTMKVDKLREITKSQLHQRSRKLPLVQHKGKSYVVWQRSLEQSVRRLAFAAVALEDEARSVFHAHADHDQNRIVLLRAALDRRHRSPWRNRKCSLLCVGGRARTTNRCRYIACGPAGQVRHVIECRAL